MSKDKRSNPVDKRSGAPSAMDNVALVLVRGGGDLASGVALRLHRAGLKLIITELAQPLAVRRAVSFAETVYAERHTVEGATARLVKQDQPRPPEEHRDYPGTARQGRRSEFQRHSPAPASGAGVYLAQVQVRVAVTLEADEIPVLIDPDADILLSSFHFPVVIDARLRKTPPHPLPTDVSLHIGLGPGFQAGINCHAVIETRRGHTLGRVYWNGATQPDSGQPEGDPRRVLRAPMDGLLIGHKQIGDHCESGDLIAEIQSEIENRKSKIVSPFKGVLRGLIHEGVRVTKGLKIGDVDPRNDPSACFLVSDKALAIGGAVLEAILTREEIRAKLW